MRDEAKKVEQYSVQDVISLPELVWSKRHALGTIKHLVRPQQDDAINEKTRIRVSARIEEPFLVLASGEKVVLTRRRTCPHPDDADGVLQLQDDGSYTWLSHRLLEKQYQENEWKRLKTDISLSWQPGIRYVAEEINNAGNIVRPGLRPPQIGALHGIGAHWSLHRTPATIIMPTGTGKTETMIAALVGEIHGSLLVVTPSTSLRRQTQRKFLSLGLLRQLGVIGDEVRNPIVGTITKRPRAEDDLDIFTDCHVVIATMSVVSQGTATDLGSQIADRCSSLIIDEAHHVTAKSWSSFRDHFADRRVLQFTATPYRRDGMLVDGDIIYSYPLRRAQEDGYFKPINFEPVCEIDGKDADYAISRKAVEQLKADLDAGFDHILMARCGRISRAEQILNTYQKLCPQYNPVLVHSENPDAYKHLENLFSGKSRVVVCVEMLGEGFDLPQLKIAAVHDTHKSLAILLQFTGRFTRTASRNIGDATVIANIADQEVSAGLERLYSEDADWNYLLAEFSSNAAREHKELVEFLSQSAPLAEHYDQKGQVSLSPSLFRPKFSAVAYRATEFNASRFYNAISDSTEVHNAWLHAVSNTLYFVTKSEPPVQWTRAKSVHDREWHLFVVHYDSDLHLLFIHSSDKSSLHDDLAKAVGGANASLIKGDLVFRTLAGINRLQFQNIGVTRHARRNLRYALYTGADVKLALDVSQTAGSTKSNLQGTGFEDGHPVAVGCSYKGRVWSKESGSLQELTRWCKHVGTKLQNDDIETDWIIDNVMIPEEVEIFPEEMILSLEWPIEILRQQEDRILLRNNGHEVPLSLVELVFEQVSDDRRRLGFHIQYQDLQMSYEFQLTSTAGYSYRQVGGRALSITIGRRDMLLSEFLNDYPLLVRFVDLSELDGNLLVRPQETPVLSFPANRFQVWRWEGTDPKKESLWKNQNERLDSVQARAVQMFSRDAFDVIFDDDAPGEAADLVCLKMDDDVIHLALVHCKYSSQIGGARVKDVVEVCAQAVRSGRWIWNFKGLCRHITKREQLLRTGERSTRFLSGSIRELNQILRASRFKEVRGQIMVVQPGISRKGHSVQQTTVLAAAHCFLNETVGIPLDIACSE